MTWFTNVGQPIFPLKLEKAILIERKALQQVKPLSPTDSINKCNARCPLCLHSLALAPTLSLSQQFSALFNPICYLLVRRVGILIFSFPFHFIPKIGNSVVVGIRTYVAFFHLSHTRLCRPMLQHVFQIVHTFLESLLIILQCCWCCCLKEMLHKYKVCTKNYGYPENKWLCGHVMNCRTIYCHNPGFGSKFRLFNKIAWLETQPELMTLSAT